VTGQHNQPRGPPAARVWRASRSAAVRARRRIGFRGASLLAFAYLDAVIGWMLLDPANVALTRRARSYAALYAAAPPWAWAVLWLTVAATCIVQAFARRHDEAGFVGAIAVKAAWSLGMFASWVFYDAPRGWLGASVWAELAVLVAVLAGWPEPHRRTDD
jgi:hypothetical protein